MHTGNSPGNFAPSTAAASPQPSADRDSIYWSKERWRIIPQLLGPLSVQYLLIDSHHNEIVATYPKMSEAMDHRDRLDPIISEFRERAAIRVSAVWAGRQAAKEVADRG